MARIEDKQFFDIGVVHMPRCCMECSARVTAADMGYRGADTFDYHYCSATVFYDPYDALSPLWFSEIHNPWRRPRFCPLTIRGHLIQAIRWPAYRAAQRRKIRALKDVIEKKGGGGGGG